MTKNGLIRLLRWTLVGACLLLGGLAQARADYIAEVKQGTQPGYLYIGRRMTKWQGGTDWAYGDMILRDDKQTMYFIQVARSRGELPATGGLSPAEVQARVAQTRKEMESAAGTSPADVPHLQAVTTVPYETRVVPYSQVGARRQISYNRAIQMKNDILAHAQTFEAVVMIDAYMSGSPSRTKTGETAVIAGKQCVKYQLVMAPVFTADVWMTEELGPGYTAGNMFDKVFDLNRGGVRPLEALHDIPGFPLKIKAQQRDVFGKGISQFEYEVLSLMETDLDEKEFGPKPGSRVYDGAYPGMDD